MVARAAGTAGHSETLPCDLMRVWQFADPKALRQWDIGGASQAWRSRHQQQSERGGAGPSGPSA